MNLNSANQPLVSVILPTYNRAEELPRAIESVQHQDYENWELIIWDDGSTDDTRHVVKAFDDPRICYHFAPNGGVSYARNQAMARARGEFIAFIDSDDQWLGGKLRTQIAFLIEHPEIDVVFSDFENVDVEHQTRESWFDYSRVGLDHHEQESYSAGFRKLSKGFPESLLLGVFIGLPTIVVRNTHEKRQMVKFNEQLRSKEDLELWWRLGLQGYQFAYSDHVFMRRYRLANGLAQPNARYWSDLVHALDLCQEQARQAHYPAAYPLLRKKLQNAWLKRAIALKDEKQGHSNIIDAFFRSLLYGLNRRSLSALAELILKRKGRQLMRKFNRKVGRDSSQ